jgi:hypothetical protein
MLGGPQRRALFMMTAPSSMADIARASRRGLIEVADVPTPRAGWP